MVNIHATDLIFSSFQPEYTLFYLLFIHFMGLTVTEMPKTAILANQDFFENIQFLVKTLIKGKCLNTVRHDKMIGLI